MFQELPTQNEYFMFADEKLFIDLWRGKRCTNEIEKLNGDDSHLTITIQLKTPAAEKMRLRVTGYYQGEYIYSMRERDSL